MKIKGRGTASLIPNRFEKQHREKDDESLLHTIEDRSPTTVIKDQAKTILAKNDSPDIPFNYSLNAYRGCEHGCAYCYARPTHEFLGYSAGLDFETKIVIKENAPELLRRELMAKSWVAEPITMSGVTDCYQPLERKYELTRKCLQVLWDFKNPVSIITKNALVTRDLDLLGALAELNLVSVWLSVTTLDTELCRVLEPRSSQPAYRLRAIETLARAGIPVGVNVAPVIAGLTDSEMPAILKAARDAGAREAGFVPLRLPLAVAPIFAEWLATHRPERKAKVLNLQRSLRDGKLNDSRFGSRMRGAGVFAENLRQIFNLGCKQLGLNRERAPLATRHFERPRSQLGLFDSKD